MKTNQIKSKYVLLLLMIGTAFSSCTKEDSVDGDPQENNPTITLECNSFQENNMDAILVLKNRNDGVDYIIDCITSVEVDLKIEPGVVIEFADAAGMNIRNSGSINAVGTQSEPINFSAVNKTKGGWKGIISSSESIKNQFDYVTMEYAGAPGLSSLGETGSLILFKDTYFRLNNVTIKNGLNYGINSTYWNDNVEINDCIITGCDIPIYAEFNVATHISGGDFTGNTTDVIRLSAGDLNATTHTWKDLGVPYRIADDLGIFGGAKLTLEPGVILEFEDTKGVVIDKNFDKGSALIAIGTSANPIVFTGVTKAAGAWKSIYCYRSTSIQNKMEHLLIEYAGGSGAKGAIETWTEAIVNVTNSTFKDIDGCAIYAHIHENPNIAQSNNTTENVSGELMCHD